MKFKKKPVVIEAEQYIAEKHEPNGLCWELGHGCDCPHLHTLEGVYIVSDNDWVITGIKGEKYSCKPDIFEMTYEPVEAITEVQGEYSD